MATTKKRSQPFIYWDVSFLDQVGDEFVADCIFCGKNRHFYANSSTGSFTCKKCRKEGSWRDFLKFVYEKHLANTTDEQLLKLTKAKGIPLPILKQKGIAFSRRRYIFPVYNYDKEISDLRVFRIGKKEISTGGADTGLYGFEQLHDQARIKEPVYICEAGLDKLALDWLLWRTENLGIVLSAPGSNTFKDEWGHSGLFDNRDVILCYDNDEAGYGYLDETNFKAEGSRKVEAKLRNSANSIRFLIWDDKFRKGYDVRDFVNDEKSKYSPDRIYASFQKLIFSHHKQEAKSIYSSVAESNGSPVKFSEIISEVKELNIETNDNFINATKIALATAISVKIPGNSPAWMFLTGPSGIGKSLILSMMKGCKKVIWESTLSRTGLVSGLGIGKTSLDFSILNRVNNKCLVLQDFTTVLGKREAEQEEIFSLLREAYNGSANWTFGNGRRVYTCNFSFVAGVTGAINLVAKSDVGERFLKYRLHPENFDEDALQDAALDYEFNQADNSKLRELVSDFITYPYDFEKENLIGMIPNWFKQKIKPLARFTAKLRSKVVRHEKGIQFGQIAYKAESEIANRIVVQFQKLGLSLAFLDNKKEIDEEIYNLIYRIGIDTAEGFKLDIINALLKEKSLAVKGINQLIPEMDKVMPYLEDMKILGLVERNGSIYKPSKMIKDLYGRSQL